VTVVLVEPVIVALKKGPCALFRAKPPGNTVFGERRFAKTGLGQIRKTTGKTQPFFLTAAVFGADFKAVLGAEHNPATFRALAIAHDSSRRAVRGDAGDGGAAADQARLPVYVVTRRQCKAMRDGLLVEDMDAAPEAFGARGVGEIERRRHERVRPGGVRSEAVVSRLTHANLKGLERGVDGAGGPCEPSQPGLLLFVRSLSGYNLESFTYRKPPKQTLSVAIVPPSGPICTNPIGKLGSVPWPVPACHSRLHSSIIIS
jgi:hypothetical protein